ncbi:MAG: hypothetical protein OXI96_00465 [Acidimicrobiaceae bacterium]|nr:hypothetical protein [Acidimicrobiaceae bacterium]
MAVLFLRNVPRDVIKRLKTLAAHEGRSVSKTAVRELDKSTRWVYNALLLKDSLRKDSPSLDVSVEEVLEIIDDGRAERDTRIDEWFVDR